MRVVLLNPNYSFWKPENEYLLKAIGQQAPLGLLSLASYARAHLDWVQIRIIDARLTLLSPAEMVARITAMTPDLVGITITTVMAEDAAVIAQMLKQALPGMVIIAGGPHVSGSGVKVLEECAAFDAAVFGEGEETFTELLKALRGGKPFATIPGVIYRDGEGAIRRNAPRPFIEDLDTLPALEWRLLDGFPEAYPPNIFFSPGGSKASLTTSRGCPFSCKFCDQSTFGRRFRAVSAQKVIAGVRELQEEYGVKYIVFCDDTFTLDRERVFAICEGMARLKPGISWTCDANVMTVDAELLRSMRKAGCWSISYGLESGSEKILRAIGKRVDLRHGRHVITETRKAGIHAKGLFILGTPEESAESIRETRDFIMSVPLSSINLSKFTPYPGTALDAEIHREEPVAYRMLNGMHFVMPSRHLSIKELDDGYERILRDFYNTVISWRIHMGMAISSRENARKFITILPGLLRHVIRAKIRKEPEDS